MGLLPDPVTSTVVPGEDDEPFYGGYFQAICKDLGGGEDVLVGPSSRWVDSERYPDWLGAGTSWEGTMELKMEQEMRTHDFLCSCNKSMAYRQRL